MEAEGWRNEIAESINEYTRDHIAFMARKSQKTYSAAMSQFLRFATEKGIYNLDDVKDVVVSGEFADYLRRTRTAELSIQYYINRVKQWMAFADKPFQHVHKIPSVDRKMKRHKDSGRWLSTDEVRAIIKKADEDERPETSLIINMLVDTGMRISELMNLKIENIDIGNRAAFIDESKTMPRWVCFSKKTTRIVQKYIDDSTRTRGLLFDLSVDMLQARANYVLSSCGLKKERDGRGPHTLRHYCASYLYFHGIPPDLIALMFGDKVEIILSTYIHASDPSWVLKRYSSIFDKMEEDHK